MKVFAIDVGGVLAPWDHSGSPQPGSLDVINRLKKKLDLWVVSQCGAKRQIETRECLEQHNFPIPKEKQIYVDFKHNKTDPLNEIKASYFIDDHLKHVAPALLKCCSQNLKLFFICQIDLRKAEFLLEPEIKKTILDTSIVNSWQEVGIWLYLLEC
jgi:hypothetical protein